MRYDNIHKAVFLARPNRFIAQVELAGEGRGRISHQSVDWFEMTEGTCVDWFEMTKGTCADRFEMTKGTCVDCFEMTGELVTVHVKNTGRCKELLVPGATVWLEKSGNPARKTAYDLVMVEKTIVSRGTNVLLVNMDSQAPNRIFQEWAQGGHFRPDLTLLRPETTWGSSRFDFYWEDAAGNRGFVEVKGCTLEEDGHARFPDAPTLRGVKHLEELVACKAAGYEATVFFVLQMEGMTDFAPNDDTHPAFGEALRRAERAGVEVLAYDCKVMPGEVTLARPVPVVL